MRPEEKAVVDAAVKYAQAHCRLYADSDNMYDAIEQTSDDLRAAVNEMIEYQSSDEYVPMPDPSEVVPTRHMRAADDTSVEASWRSAGSAAAQRGVLLRMMHDVGRNGLTVLEATPPMKQIFPKLRTVHPRMIELRQKGWVLKLEHTRLTDTGTPAHVNVFNFDAETEYQVWMQKEKEKANR